MKAVIVVGTDTDSGKTLICGLLAGYWIDNRINAVTQKFVQTGASPDKSDICAHWELMNADKSKFVKYLPDILPYCFKFAGSPHLAARLEGKKIDLSKIIESFKNLQSKFDFVVVESSGGALVPINERQLLIDIASKLRLPVIIVADNKLGAINQSLLTIEALKSRGMNILGVIFNQVRPGVDSEIIMDNPRAVERLAKVKVLGLLSYSKNKRNLAEQFKPIGKKILDLAKK